MRLLVVVNEPANWPLEIPGVEVVAARQYLADPAFYDVRTARVFNLCRSYAYQSVGYYVSLLAEARGHAPRPDVITIQDMRSSAISRALIGDLAQLVQKTLHTVKSDRFVLSIYFGRTLAVRDRSLGRRLFEIFRCPMLRAQFAKKDDEWVLQSIRPISGSEIPEPHRSFVLEAAAKFFGSGNRSTPRKKPYRYDLAILTDEDDASPPSDEKAIQKFEKAAARQSVRTERIDRDDYSRLAEFDALFIRTTTQVNHYTYRFARRAQADGLAVIDDPLSIARCTNKVYLAERLAAHDVPVPRTWVVHRDNVDRVLQEVGLPCVLKQPDSSFSVGVRKAHDVSEYLAMATEMLEHSDLIVVQEFIPTDFDWRVGVLDGQPLYACKYNMSRGHWQIIQRDSDGQTTSGKVETMPVELAPSQVIRTAVKAAGLIGNGLYGVDLKQVGRKVVVIEVNDNPNLDAGYEDKILKDALYDRLVSSFIGRIEAIRQGN